MQVDTGGCCGRCCERFLLRISPEELEHQLWLKKLGGELSLQVDDLETLHEMLIYLGKSALNGNGRYDDIESHWYTCRYYDRQTHLCQIYERRPKLCHTHGDVPWNPCLYEGCQKGRSEMRVDKDIRASEERLDEAFKTTRAKTTRLQELVKKKNENPLDDELRVVRRALENAQHDLKNRDAEIAKLKLQLYMAEREKAAWQTKALDLVTDERAMNPWAEHKLAGIGSLIHSPPLDKILESVVHKSKVKQS